MRIASTQEIRNAGLAPIGGLDSILPVRANLTLHSLNRFNELATKLQLRHGVFLLTIGGNGSFVERLSHRRRKPISLIRRFWWR